MNGNRLGNQVAGCRFIFFLCGGFQFVVHMAGAMRMMHGFYVCGVPEMVRQKIVYQGQKWFAYRYRVK